MAESQLKSELICTELDSRIRAAFPTVQIEWGFFDTEVSVFPSIYLFEDVENATLDRTQRRGMYERELSIGISYFIKGPSTPRGEVYHKVRTELQKVYEAVESDQNFNGLCTHFGVNSVDRIFYKANVVQLAILYVFTYAEFAPWAINNRRM